MVRRFAILSLLILACGREAPFSVAADPAPRHYDIRFEQLPPPFATSSAFSPPWVSRRPAGATLHVPPGFSIAEYASGLDDPRNMLLAPNGDVLLAEPGAGRVTVLRDANHDGVAELRYTLIGGLNEPFGLAFYLGYLYIGDVDAVVRIPHTPGQTQSKAQPQRIAPLPSGGHSTRGIVFNRAGTKMYVSVGSASNVSSGGPPERAAILELNPDGTGKRIFASGLRNPVGLAWEPVTGALWTAVNERDGMGEDQVPDYVTDVRDGAFYGWPYAFIGPHEDSRRRGERPDLVRKTIPPTLLVQAHSAALGIAFYEGTMFPPEYRGSAFVAFHGSWNRSLRTGYKVISIPFRNGRPTGGYDDFVTGWMTDERSRNVWGGRLVCSCSLMARSSSVMMAAGESGASRIRVRADLAS